MKQLIHFILLFIVSACYANELSWVNEQVKAIEPTRHGINNSTISNMKDPFIFLKKNGYKRLKQEKTKKTISKKTKTIPVPRKVHKKLTLEMIMNSSARINGHWYKIGDNVYGYILTMVNKGTVNLAIDGKKSHLSIQSKKSNLKFKKR